MTNQKQFITKKRKNIMIITKNNPGMRQKSDLEVAREKINIIRR